MTPAEYPSKQGILKSVTVAGYTHLSGLLSRNNRLGLLGFEMCVKLFLQICISAGILTSASLAFSTCSSILPCDPIIAK